MSKILDQVKTFFTSRKRAYEFTFNLDDIDNQIVLRDLAKFCRAHSTTFHEDARVSAVLEGRREVWLRIQTYLNLTPDELWDFYKRRDIDE